MTVAFVLFRHANKETQRAGRGPRLTVDGVPGVTPDADAAAVARVLQGDAAAFAGIVERWQGPLVNLAYRFVRDRGRAEEMAQEAFLRACRGLATWRGDAAFSTWLFAVATNLYRAEIRRIPPLVPLDGIAEPAARDGLEATIEAVDRRRLVRRMLRGGHVAQSRSPGRDGQGAVGARARHAALQAVSRARHDRTEGVPMKPDEVDRWLTDEEAIVPSSGFSVSVMEAVVREAATPPAIPFPWTRALPGLASLGVALLAVLAGTTFLGAWPADAAAPSSVLQVISAGDEAGWIAAALMVTAASLAWSWRLARG